MFVFEKGKKKSILMHSIELLRINLREKETGVYLWFLMNNIASKLAVRNVT